MTNTNGNNLLCSKLQSNHMYDCQEHVTECLGGHQVKPQIFIEMEKERGNTSVRISDGTLRKLW